MEAVILTNYGNPDVLQLKNIDKPIPKDDEILIKVHSVSVSMGDCEMRSLNMSLFMRMAIRLFFGFFKPRRQVILGQEVSGIVESVGKSITQYKKGDSVFGHLGFEMGGYAEYAILSKDAIITKKPEFISDQEAVTLPVGGSNALHFLRKANIESGQKILINGAGGSIGTIAIQIAKSYGAIVTAVDSSRKLNMLKSIGADFVIDYRTENFTQANLKYDIILDVVGKASYNGCIQSLKNNGYYLIANPKFIHRIRKFWTNVFQNKKVIAETANESPEDLEELITLIKEEALKPMVDKEFSLGQITEAHRYVESGQRNHGTVVISLV